MRVLVCGGRDFDDYNLLADTLLGLLEQYGSKDVIFISGRARGADSLGEWFAKANNYELLVFPADWGKFGKAAGFIRNQQMIDEGKPDLVVAFPGGRGTQDMVKRAKKHGIKVDEVKDGKRNKCRS